VEKGSSSNGYVGYNALDVFNVGDKYVSKITIDNGFVIYNDGAEKILTRHAGVETELVIPSYVTEIREGAFNSCARLTSVVIPEGVKVIGANAFRSCIKLGEIEIPNSVTEIGGNAFYGCSKLSRVIIGSGVKKLDNSEFASCTALKSVVIGENVSSISSHAFNSSTKITSVVFKDTSTWYQTTRKEYWWNKQYGDTIDVTDSTSFVKTLTCGSTYYWYKL
jgi:hypothetical protein